MFQQNSVANLGSLLGANLITVPFSRANSKFMFATVVFVVAVAKTPP